MQGGSYWAQPSRSGAWGLSQAVFPRALGRAEYRPRARWAGRSRSAVR